MTRPAPDLATTLATVLVILLAAAVPALADCPPVGETAIVTADGTGTSAPATTGAAATAEASVPSTSAADAGAKSDFDRLLELTGEWEAVSPEGKTARLVFEPISNSTAVLERLTIGTDGMVSVYHRDGDSLRLTHYCGTDNQPRMRQVSSSADGELRFAFVDVTNLDSPLEGHMRQIAYVFRDDEHFTQKLRWREQGYEMEMVLEFERVR
jgi:hypothetical protein